MFASLFKADISWIFSIKLLSLKSIGKNGKAETKKFCTFRPSRLVSTYQFTSRVFTNFSNDFQISTSSIDGDRECSEPSIRIFHPRCRVRILSDFQSFVCRPLILTFITIFFRISRMLDTDLWCKIWI